MFVLGIGGTTRADSSTEKAVRWCLTRAERSGAETMLLGAADLDLPMYAPETPTRTAAAEHLVAMMRRADGVIVGSPGYHGTLSGLVKNALDYAEALRDDDPPYLDGRVIGTIACAYGWPATIHTLAALRSVAHALRGWPTPMGAGINSAEGIFDDDGRVVDQRSRFQLELVADQVVEFAALRHAAR